MQTTTVTQLDEINDYINSGNISVGFRRLLDLCLDTELNHQQKLEVLNLCEKLNQFIDNNDKLDNEFIIKLLGFADEIYNINIQGKVDTPITKVVDAYGISKVYSSGVFQLSQIDLSINHGQLVGIVGENGNGKTTLLRMIASDLSLNDGEILYDFGTLKTETLYDIKRPIAYIPQRIPRWYGKLKNNLHFAAASRGIYGFENEYLVNVMLTRLGLNKFKNLFWTQISSGYRTRFELARILLLQPKLLVLDEPLANLDINAQQTFLQDLRNLAKSTKNPLAILFSSQQLHEVEKVADHIVFLRNGKSIYNSTTAGDDLLNTHTETEIETTFTRDQLLKALVNIDNLSVTKQGSVYIIRCDKKVESMVILNKLLGFGVTLTYYRDLTHSTKKFFNQN